MKANKARGDKQQQLTGTVVQKMFSPGSKSEHYAIGIETTEGYFKIRRRGGNPFNDPQLTQLVGKKITATGVLNQTIFFATTIEVIC